MKLLSIVKVAVLALPLALVSCKSHKSATTDTTMKKVKKGDLISNVQDNAQTGKFFTSKVKFSVEVGPQKLTLTGNLRMRRHDVIRLQLMAFGFVEAGRIELTKEYVLIMDRINKQYLKAPWMSVDFLRNSGLNFQVIQALFWNELFRPNQTTLVKTNDKLIVDSIANYTLLESGDDMIIGLEEGKMEYSWLASRAGAILRMANVLYKDRFNGNTQLNWDYDEFISLNKKAFPQKSAITLTTPEKEVKLGMTLKYIKHDSEWETRTEISNKYREVSVDEILRRFMSL